MRPINSKEIGLVLTFLLALFFIGYMLFLGDNVLDPGDGVKHFQTSKFSWKYLHLLFDHWGKPIYTLFTSPFAQLGFQGMIVFNILLYVLSSVFLLKICEELSVKNSWLIVVFCFSSPIYFWLVLSGLTEVLMATICVLVLYLFLKEKFFLGCVLLSFSLFSRPESNMVIPWYMLFLIIGKNYKYIPLIFTGPIIYSVLGYFHYDDIFWIVTKRPYSSTETYGSGELFHFVMGYKQILGSVISFSFILGMGFLLFSVVQKKFSNITQETKWLLLVLFPVGSVLIVHSFVWWEGMQGSAGYFRVMATMVPFACLVALFGINKLVDLISNKAQMVSKGIVVALILLGTGSVYLSFKNIPIDERLMVEQRTLVKVAEWYKSKGNDQKIYYMSPYFAYQANIDPFSEKGQRDNMKRFSDKQTPSNNMKTGELILWDGQFSQNEAKMPLMLFLKDDNLELIQSFYPERDVKFYGRYYSAQLFVKVDGKSKEQNIKVEKKYFKRNEKTTIIKDFKYYLNRIGNDEEWMKEISKKAKERNLSVDSVLVLDATFWAKKNDF